MRGFGGACQAGLSHWRRRGWCASRQAADGAVAAISVRRSAWPRLASGAESPERDRTAGGRIGAAARAFDQRASHRYAALHARAHSDATGDRSYDRGLGRGAQGVLDCDRVRFWAAAGGDHSAAASHPCRDSGVAMTAQIAIRPLRLDERVAWEPLWKGYLDFYRTTAPQETYDATWARLHDPNEPMWLLGGYVDGKLLGIVHYIYHRSCWTIGDYCYLQDAKWREECVVSVERRFTHGGILAALIDLAADWALVRQTGRGVPTIDMRVDYPKAPRGHQENEPSRGNALHDRRTRTARRLARRANRSALPRDGVGRVGLELAGDEVCLLGMAAAVSAGLGRRDRCGGACALCCRNRRQPESACGSVAPAHHLGDPQRRAVGRGDELCAALAASERGRRHCLHYAGVDGAARLAAAWRAFDAASRHSACHGVCRPRLVVRRRRHVGQHGEIARRFARADRFGRLCGRHDFPEAVSDSTAERDIGDLADRDRQRAHCACRHTPRASAYCGTIIGRLVRARLYDPRRPLHRLCHLVWRG